MGIALVGIGLLGPRGLAGAALYLLGHGLIKDALFMCAGVLLALRGAIDEGDLRGRGRGLPWTGLQPAASRSPGCRAKSATRVEA